MDYEKKYNDLVRAVKELQEANPSDEGIQNWVNENVPELAESEDERIRKAILEHIQLCTESIPDRDKFIAWLEKQGQTFTKKDVDDAYLKGVCDAKQKLEKQGEQNHYMIQWKGDNLKEVVDFTGKDKNFEKWFKSFEEYKKYVSEHNNIFKLFNSDGSHFEVPIGAWIVKTPDGYNVASKAVFKQKIAWSEEDEKMIEAALQFAHEYGRHGLWCWLKSLKGRVQPNQEWSEEDERMRQYVVNDLRFVKELVSNPNYAVNAKSVEKEIVWMESLKERYTWKPSKHELEVLKLVAEKDGTCLMGLYEQLKKLRGNSYESEHTIR